MNDNTSSSRRSAKSKPLSVPCPHCQTDVIWSEQSPFRPFCSERCQQADLGAWASEEYSIPCKEPADWQEQDS